MKQTTNAQKQNTKPTKQKQYVGKSVSRTKVKVLAPEKKADSFDTKSYRLAQIFYFYLKKQSVCSRYCTNG